MGTTSEDWAWLAGLFEGEGSIVHRQTNTGGRYRSTIAIKIAMKDRDVIENVQSVTNCGSINTTTQRGVIMHHWTVAGMDNVLRVLRCIWPYLFSRRRSKILEVFDEYNSAPVKRMHKKTLDISLLEPLN